MKYFRWTVTIGYAGFIFYLSSRTWGDVPSFLYVDKLFHLILYFGLGVLLLWALRTTRLKGCPYLVATAIVIATLYGLTDEIHQSFVPGREFSYLDILADAIGSALGTLAVAKKGEKGETPPMYDA